jgi:hypothetical protein
VGFGAGVVEGPEEDRGDLVLNGTLVSANCGLALALEGSSSHLAQHYAKAIRYTACMTALALLQVRLSGWSPCRLVPEVIAVIVEGSDCPVVSTNRPWLEWARPCPWWFFS